MRKFLKSGDPFIWLTGGALAFSLLMITGLIALIMVNGLGQFWPSSLVEIHLKNGDKLLGEIWNRERIPPQMLPENQPPHYRIRIKIGNRDLYALDFKWVDELDIQKQLKPAEALAVERLEWGNFYGYFRALKVEDEVVDTVLVSAWPKIQMYLDEMHRLYDRIHKIETTVIGDINYDLDKTRLQIKRIYLREDTTRTDVQARLRDLHQQIARLEALYQEQEMQLEQLYEQSRRYYVTLVTADGLEKDIKLFDIVRIYRPNAMFWFSKMRFYVAKFWEFISDEPRESNTEGGVFPALFGTVMLVIIMSIAVVPLGVLAAVYLHEYARQGWLVRMIRIAVNNLAGVPSIVYGMFGLGFFIYTVGGTIDRLFFPEALPAPTYGTGGLLWASLTLALLTVPVVIVSTEEGLAAVPREIREGSMALSATKFETIWRIVLPGALPGILTGLILAIARAAGEVAPLMITGVVKLAPALPVDSNFPFIHLERKFMHLGFHIYDVGFQSPNVEAAIPMVYSTTLLLLLIVLLLNVMAITVRNRLRKKLAYGVF